MAHTEEVTGYHLIKAGRHVGFAEGVAFNMHQVESGVIPTLDVYGSFSNEPKTGQGVGILTDSASTMVDVDIHSGGAMVVQGRTGTAIGVIDDCPMTFVNDGQISISGTRVSTVGFEVSGNGLMLTNTGGIDVGSETMGATGFEIGGRSAYVNNSGGVYVDGASAHGLVDSGDGLGFINSGVFEVGGKGELVGLAIGSSGAMIDNQGQITIDGAGDGIEITHGASVSITNSGTITATDAVIENTGVTSDVTLFNSGHIDGAVVLGLGNDHIENSGVISKAVHLGGGDDVFEMSGHSHVRGGVYGGDGNDTLTGARADDHLFGADGDDQLNGAGGADVLSGGAGSNVFVYQAIKDSTAAHSDLITDLSSDDRIDLSGIDADTTMSGDQAFRLVSAFDGHAGELVVSYDSANNTTLIQGDVNGDGVADLVIRATGDHTDFTGFTL